MIGMALLDDGRPSNIGPLRRLEGALRRRRLSFDNARFL